MIFQYNSARFRDLIDVYIEAIKKGDKWWLYVVEFVGTDEQKIYRLPNPFIRMGNLQIDVAWKGLHQEE